VNTSKNNLRGFGAERKGNGHQAIRPRRPTSSGRNKDCFRKPFPTVDVARVSTLICSVESCNLVVKTVHNPSDAKAAVAARSHTKLSGLGNSRLLLSQWTSTLPTLSCTFVPMWGRLRNRSQNQRHVALIPRYFISFHCPL